MISRYERLLGVTTEISKLISKISAIEMKRYGLRGSWARYLLLIKEHDGTVTAARLSTLSSRNKADVSRSLAELEEQGLVERTSSAAYRAKLTLTPKGREIAEALYARASEIVEAASEGIGDEDRKILYAALARLSKNLSEISKSPTRGTE